MLTSISSIVLNLEDMSVFEGWDCNVDAQSTVVMTMMVK